MEKKKTKKGENNAFKKKRIWNVNFKSQHLILDFKKRQWMWAHQRPNALEHLGSLLLKKVGIHRHVQLQYLDDNVCELGGVSYH